jgi:hypothetical protein
MTIAGMILAAAVAPLSLLALGVAQAAPEAPAMSRPADLAGWTTLGATLRMSAAAPSVPEQFRQVQLKPADYQAFLRDRAYPDGAAFGVTFHKARRDESETPTLYAPDKEFLFALEVLDKRHPDGRRFYTFAPGATAAQPLPPGNACAACHNAKGDLQGTFSRDYPLTAAYVPGPAEQGATEKGRSSRSGPSASIAQRKP